MSRRKVRVVLVDRANYGRLEPVMRAIADHPATMAKSVGFGVVEFASEFQRLAPELVVLIDDRHEALAAAIAAAYMNICIVHIPREVAGFTLMCVMDDMNQRRVFVLRRDSAEFKLRGAWKGTYKVTLRIPPLWLEPGRGSTLSADMQWNCQEAPVVDSSEVAVV